MGSVDQQASYQLMGVSQATHERNALLEQEANAAVLDYEQKRVQDEFARQQYEHQKRAVEKKMELEAEMAKHREAYAMKARAMQEQYAMQGAALQAQAASAGATRRDLMPSYVAAPMAPAAGAAACSAGGQYA